MHGSIRERLEDLLAARGAAAGKEASAAHLLRCAECSTELESMKAQAGLIRTTLRPPEELEPAPGFYARVLQRIEEHAKESMWAVFTDSPFGKRLAYASLMVALMLGAYVVTQESRDGHLGGPRIVAQSMHQDALVAGSPAEQRDAVLENFAAHPVLVSSEGSLQ